MAPYIQRPQRVDAIQWTGDNWQAVSDWFSSMPGGNILKRQQDGHLFLATHALQAPIEPGDWLISNENGVMFMCNDETFGLRYVGADEQILDPDGGSHENPLGG